MRGNSVVRVVALGISLGAIGAMGAGCAERGIALGGGMGGNGGTGGTRVISGWQILPNLGAAKADVLFMVDDSASMQTFQPRLAEAFPDFIHTLQSLPSGPPSLNIAVISSDSGPGKFDLPAYHCPYGGDRGQFQFTPRASCATSPYLPGRTFMSVTNDVPTFTGSLADAFNCTALLGDQGCGFEGQLKSVRWALDPLNVPFSNGGFLRSDAALAVVLLTNEDDCSVPDDSDLFDPTQTRLSDMLGPFKSFRCNEFGHRCNIGGQVQSPPRAAVDNLIGCVPNDTASSRLTKVADEVAFLKSLKTDPGRIIAAAITGPATPYGTQIVKDPADTEPHAEVKHSCQTTTGGGYADPALRLKEWTDNFGSNGLLTSICDDSLSPALVSVADAIGRAVGIRCVSGPFPVPSPGAQPACRLIDGTLTQNEGPVGTLVSNCANSFGSSPCWTIADDSRCTGGSKLLNVDRGGAPEPSTGSIFTCQSCPTDRLEIGCPLPQPTDAGGLP